MSDATSDSPFQNAKAVVAKLEIFQGLSAAEIDSLIALCREATYESGDVIFEEGTDGDELFIMPQGRVSVEIRLGGDVVTERIYQVRDNEAFGELALVDGYRRSARARAMENIRLLVLSRKDLLPLMNRQNHLGFVIMGNLSRILAAKLRDTNIALRNALMQQKYVLNEFH